MHGFHLSITAILVRQVHPIYTPTGQSADYLIIAKNFIEHLYQISLELLDRMTLRMRMIILVLISSTDSLIGSFTDTIMVVER
jgi:hypothetical protein